MAKLTVNKFGNKQCICPGTIRSMVQVSLRNRVMIFTGKLLSKFILCLIPSGSIFLVMRQETT